MKKPTFFKTLLVAAGLLGGVNVWADDYDFTQVATYDFEGETPTNPFTDKSGISGRCNASTYTDETTSSTALKFVGSNLSGKTYGYYVYDFSASTASSSVVKIAFDFKMADQTYTHFTIRDASIAEETNKSSYSGTGSIFRFGNSRVSRSNQFGYNGNAVSGASYDTWYHIEVIVDVVNKKVSYTLKSFDQTTTIDSKSNLAFLNSTATACTQLDFFGINNAEMASIDNIVVSEHTSASATTYSVEKYDKSGNLLSTTTNLAGVAGETSSVTDADKNTFYSADTNSKYVYDNSDERNVTSLELTSTEATNVLKLYFNTYSKYTATVQSVCGENSVADITGSWYADETPATLYWPKVVSCPDGYYIVEAAASAPYYGYTFSTSDLTKTVTYTLDDDIAYYAEYESILTDKNNYEYFPTQSSKGTSRCIQKSGVMKTAMNLSETGVYDVIFACGNRDDSHTSSLELKLIASDNTISTENVISASFRGGEWKGELTASKVTIPAGSELYLTNDNGTGNARIAGDYILVRKSHASAVISSAGYASFSSIYPLDLDNISGGTAYMVTSNVENGYITLTEAIGKVAAGTGLIIKGDAGTVTIPVAATGTDYSATNKLVAVTTTGSVAAGNYILAANKDGSEAGFYLLDEAISLDAGKAYLPASAVSGGAKARFLFTDGASAIKTIAIDAAEDGAIYNVAGQRVNAAYKGIVIKNGKKFLVR